MKFSTSVQLSRKRKKAWRKNIDLDSFKLGLEELRKEKANGGIISEISNERLFSVDLKGDVGVYGSRKNKKLLKIDEILSNKSSIQVLSRFSQKRVKNNMDKLKLKGYKRSCTLNSGMVLLQEVNSKFNNDWLNNIKILQNQVLFKDPKLYDMWTNDCDSVNFSASNTMFLGNCFKMPSTLQHKPLSVLNDVSHIKVADSGLSYNPLFSEYKKLFEKEAFSEFSKEIENKKNVLSVSRCDFIEDTGFKKSSEDTNPKEIDGHVVTRKMIKKTRKQKKKELQKKKEANEYRKRVQQKKQIKDLNCIDKIVNLIEEKACTRKLVSKDSGYRIASKGKFKKHSIAIRPLEIQLPDELVDSFRLIKPDGNMFMDRFISLQERGLIEPRFPVISNRKYSQRYVDKWNYREFKL